MFIFLNASVIAKPVKFSKKSNNYINSYVHSIFDDISVGADSEEKQELFPEPVAVYKVLSNFSNG